MENSKRFYWIKLKTNFFNREDIDFLLSQKNGAEYVVLYQMLCLNTANNNGKLETKMGEIIIPYNAEKIVRDCKYFDFDTVTVALELYKKLGLVYQEEDGNLKITDFDDMVGSFKTDDHTRMLNAERQKNFRERQKEIHNVTVTEDVTLNRNVEYRDKSIENRDKILDIDNKNIDIINEHLAPTKIKKEFEKQYIQEFENIWKHYPNKKGKEQALKKYILARNQGTSYEAIAQGLKKYINYIKSENIEEKYIKHGSTWFNQKCWNDDYKISNKKSQNDEQWELLKGVYDGTIKIK